MTTKQRHPHSAAASEANGDKIVITLFAPNDTDNNSRILRLVLSAEDGSVLAAIEDGDEDGALERAGFAGCATSLHFYVDGAEYERALEGCPPQRPGQHGTASPGSARTSAQ